MKKFDYNFEKNLDENVEHLLFQLQEVSKDDFSAGELILWFQGLGVQVGHVQYNADSYKKELFEALRELKSLKDELEGYRFANITPVNVKMLTKAELKAKKHFFGNQGNG